MITRITKGVSGFADYMLYGKKIGAGERHKRDDVTVLYGSIEAFRKYENYVTSQKNYVNNYCHITISFSKEDTDKLNSLAAYRQIAVKQLLIDEYINHFFHGYSHEDLVISAEEHKPKDANKLPHIHIGIGLYSPTLDKRVCNLYSNGHNLADQAIQTRLCLKCGFSIPTRDNARTAEERRNYFSENSAFYEKSKKYTRKHLVDIAREYNNLETYIADLENSLSEDCGQVKNYEIRHIKTAKNEYYSLKLEGQKDINIRGKDFEHLIKGEFAKKEQLSLKQCNEILDKAYTSQKNHLEKVNALIPRKTSERMKSPEEEVAYSDEYKNMSLDKNVLSKKRKPAYSKLYEEEKVYKKAEISYRRAFKVTLFEETYDNIIPKSLETCYIDKSHEGMVIFRENGFEIRDKGDSISATCYDDNKEKLAKKMIDLALAKGWDLEEVWVNPEGYLKEELEEEIAKRLEELRKDDDDDELSRDL